LFIKYNNSFQHKVEVLLANNLGTNIYIIFIKRKKISENILFGDKIYGEPKETLDQYVAESIQQYSKVKERQGKTAEEQIVKHISSQLITVLLSQSDQTDKSLIARLTKHKQGAAAIQIKGIVNNQLGFPCRQKTREKTVLIPIVRTSAEAKLCNNRNLYKRSKKTSSIIFLHKRPS